MIPVEELTQIKSTQQKILSTLENLQVKESKLSPYITAIEFMSAVRIRRSRFTDLVATNQIKTIKKSRKIYVHVDEIENYFKNEKIK